MKILVDGDACPAKDIIKALAQKYGVEVHVFIDSSHYFQDDFFILHIVAKGKDAVDMALINYMDYGDLVISQDYGVATMALTRTQYIVNPLGFMYTDKNIDELLFKRHITQEARRSGRTMSKIKKRTSENDTKLFNLLNTLLAQATTVE